MIVSPIGEIERPFISSYFLTLLSHKKTFSSFSLSVFLELPVHRHSGGNFRPECCLRHLSAGRPMNRELGRAERLKERKEHFSQKGIEKNKSD